jgi:hypothetical protein
MKAFVLLVLIVSFAGCGFGRKSGKARFAKSCDIEFPSDIKVVRDDMQSNGPDFSLFYDLKLDEESCAALTRSIRSSAYYCRDTAITLVNKTATLQMWEPAYMDTLGMKALWMKTPTGYRFKSQVKNGHEFTAEMDTLKMTAAFCEGLD